MSGDSDGERRRNWILSFADLLSLLLCFMVMTFAISRAERGQLAHPADTAGEALGDTIDGPGREPSSSGTRSSVDTWSSAASARPTRVLDLDYLAALFGATFEGERRLQETRIERSDDRLVLIFPDHLLFASGGIAEDARPFLGALARVLDSVDNPVEIVAHADQQSQLPGETYASHWELSVARALAVAEVLAYSGLARPIVCYGLADTGSDRSGEMPESRRPSMGRRVDLVVYASAGGDQ